MAKIKKVARHILSRQREDKMKITRSKLRQLISESMDLTSHREQWFLQELGASFYSEYDGDRPGRGIFHDKFPNNCMVRFVIFSRGDDTMYISDIEARGEDCQRKGYGRQVMETLVAKADMFDIALELDVVSYGDNISLDDLYSFYTSLGFKAAGIPNHPYRMRRYEG